MAMRFVRVLRPAVVSAAVTVSVPQIAAAQAITSAPQLTPVQTAFVNRRPLTMMPAPAEVPGAAQGASPARISPAAQPFKPTSLWKVFAYSLELMTFEQIMRVIKEPESRAELRGPFFKDWFDSVHVPKKWDDEDPWSVNYVGHAIHGSAAARIWLDQREPTATTKKQYLASMSRALLFSAIFSELFENGPISEASIGNVARRHERTGWVDHVWTPVGGILWTMGEDALDRWVLTRVDRHVPHVFARVAARMILNPGRMLANISQNRAPWYRSNRPLGFGSGRRR